MATYERLDYGSADGSQWGTSTDLIALYGAIPVAQSSLPTVGASSTYDFYSESSGSASTWAFSTIASFTSFVRQVSTLNVAMRRFGLVS